MEIIRSVDHMQSRIKTLKAEHKSVGFVPTMGYLHSGHKSLIDKARNENEFVVVSIFVNPTQFGPNEDLDKYPRNESGDFELCDKAGCDIVFIPTPEDMYRNNYNTYVDVFGLTEGLCGASRPIHFRGVCTVVLKLFNIIKPDKAYFGQKDAQQLGVIRRMVLDLNLDVNIIGCPIVREPDGLAMSSRNTYLSTDERSQALVLSKSLKKAKEMLDNDVIDVLTIKEEMVKIIEKADTSVIDYIEFVDNLTFKPVIEIEGEVLIALAVKIGKTRLIDNMVVVK